MLRTLIAKEVLDAVLSAKFLVTFVVVTVLVLSGLIIGSRNYEEQTGDVDRQQELNMRMMGSQFDWVTTGFVGTLESKRPHVLTIIDSGVEHSLGRQATVSTFQETYLDESRNTISPILAVFGDVDITFVVRIVLSLFAIMLSFDAICGERERGTLKLMIANSVPRYTILLAKIIGGILVLWVAFLLPLLLGGLYMLGFQADILAQVTGEMMIRLAGIVIIYCAFLAVIFAIGLFVSASTQRSATSFILLLMFWVLFITIIPGVSMTMAERLKPAESYATIQAKATREISEERGALFNEFMRTWMQSMAQGDFGKRRAQFASELTSMGQEIIDRYDRQHEIAQNAQIQTAQQIARLLSPTSAMSFGVQHLSGSGWARQQEYLKQLRSHRNAFVDYIDEQISQEQELNLIDLLQKRELEIEPERITFRFVEEPLVTVLGRAAPDLLVLVLELLLFFVLGHLAFQRYDIR